MPGKPKTIKSDLALKKVRRLCLALPGTTELTAWGHPTFRVGGKIFVGYGHKTVENLGILNREESFPTIGVKVGKAKQKELLADPRFTYADYVGRFGWVTMSLDGRINWNEVAGLILASYQLIAPKRIISRLDAPRRPSRRARARKTKRTVSRPKSRR